MKSKGGRPVLDSVSKRSTRIEIKCTSGDKARIVEHAQLLGLNLSSYMLKKALDHRIVQNMQETVEGLHRLNVSLVKIGNNINQLAHYANIMLLSGMFNRNLAEQVKHRLDEYLEQQTLIRQTFRKIIRELGNL